MAREYFGSVDKQYIQTTVNYYENLGRNYLVGIFDRYNETHNEDNQITNVVFTELMTKHDCEFTFGNYKCVGEIKCRLYDSTAKFLQEGIFIEKPKYEYLMNLYHTKGIIPFFVNFFADNTYIAYNLATIKPIGIKNNVQIRCKDGSYYYEDRYLLPSDNIKKTPFSTDEIRKFK